MRWTITNVSVQGFEALALSIRGGWNIFGASGGCAVCVNSIPVSQAQEPTGELPAPVIWFQSEKEQIPGFLKARLDDGMSEGVGWKFAPVRLFPQRYELALDNDCIMWALPEAIVRWLGADGSCVIAADVRPCFGQFGQLCCAEPRNSGIRGLPPNLLYEDFLARVLDNNPVLQKSELDEQGLQVAALYAAGPTHVVNVEEVAICSPLSSTFGGSRHLWRALCGPECATAAVVF